MKATGVDKSGYLTVKETTPTLLVNGWNLVTRQVLGTTRTLFVFADNVAPTFVLDPKLSTTINAADLANGSSFVVQGSVIDNSTGRTHFWQSFKLNDAEHVSALQSDPNGAFVVLTFTIKDKAGNGTIVHLRLNVSNEAILIKDIGRKDLPTITPSITLEALLTKL